MSFEKRGLTQAAAADVLKIDQPEVSALMRGRLAGFSLDRLVRFLVLLGSDVQIVVKPRPRTSGGAASWSREPRAGGSSHVLNTCLYLGVRAVLADLEEARIR